MSTQHTPGPWNAMSWSCSAPTTVVSDARGERIVVAECSGHGRHSNDSLADARLIAAAPEMFDALKAVWDFWAGGDAPKELEEQIKSAIAKAEGKA